METLGYILLALTVILYFYGITRSIYFAMKSSSLFYMVSIISSLILTITAFVLGKIYDSKMPNAISEISSYALLFFFIATLILGYFAERNFKKSKVDKKLGDDNA